MTNATPDSAALTVDYRPLDALIPYARNARTHSEAQVAQIAASIREFGWTTPILVDEDGGVIAGHGRLLAARKLGLSQAPCISLTGLSESQRRAYVLADNRLALNAGWDEEMLRLELGDLADSDIDLSLIGFGDDELAALMADRTEGLTDPDEVPDPPINPVSQPGDLWRLGGHHLLCGDCTVAKDVERVLAGTIPHLMVTDPPYGVAYDAAWRVRRGLSDTAATGTVHGDDRADWRDAWALFPGNVAYVWHAGLQSWVVADSLLASGFEIRGQIIWAKDRQVISQGHYHFQHEPAWYAVRKGKTAHWAGDRKQTTLWQIEHRKSDTGHSTQKPVECMRRPIVNNSSPGQAIYEPFSGSGTTIIAAEMEGRSVHAIEIAPEYVDVAVKRWQAFTGRDATLEDTGQTFSDVTDERYDPARDSRDGYDHAIAEKRRELETQSTNEVT